MFQIKTLSCYFADSKTCPSLLNFSREDIACSNNRRMQDETMTMPQHPCFPYFFHQMHQQAAAHAAEAAAATLSPSAAAAAAASGQPHPGPAEQLLHRQLTLEAQREFLLRRGVGAFSPSHPFISGEVAVHPELQGRLPFHSTGPSR